MDPQMTVPLWDANTVPLDVQPSESCIQCESSASFTYTEAKPTVTVELHEDVGNIEATRTVRVQLHPEYNHASSSNCQGEASLQANAGIAANSWRMRRTQ